jgi:hypothetical protein
MMNVERILLIIILFLTFCLVLFCFALSAFCYNGGYMIISAIMALLGVIGTFIFTVSLKLIGGKYNEM